MRNSITIGGIAFAVALAVIVGSRLSSEALAVVVGAVCGISATIPVTLALVIAASQNWGRADTAPIGLPPATPPQPPVIVVSPPPLPMTLGSLPGAHPPATPTHYLGLSPREFKIIGGE